MNGFSPCFSDMDDCFPCPEDQYPNENKNGCIPKTIHFLSFEENSAPDQSNESSLGLRDQQVLDVKSYARLFSKSVETLRAQLAEKGDGAELIWDKVSSVNAWGSVAK